MLLRFSAITLILFTTWASSTAGEKPNFIYILADELGYFEPGFMGGQTILTPHLDKLAQQGIVFRNMFAGSCVCAPSRCCLMTGQHAGHASIRVNDGGTPLRADQITIATLLKQQGYITGGFGKWGCGGRGSTGIPEQHGFDVFFGYYDQVHAHTYYPPYLVRNSLEVPLKDNKGLSQGTTYAQYVIHQQALKFLRENHQRPFYAYLPYTPPHGSFDIPDTDPAWLLYRDKPWPEPARRYAAMVTMLDRQIGEIVALLQELHIHQKTLVFFSGDNGGADYFASDDHPRGLHSANKHPKSGLEYRGKKGNLYEGGLRVPFLAVWPGNIPAGRTTELLAYFPDILPTLAELSGAPIPSKVDGLSLVPTLLGEGEQPLHDFLYWEFHGWVAIRQGDWRAVRPPQGAAWELYDLQTDPSESNNLAHVQPEKLRQLQVLAESAHEPARPGSFHEIAHHERDRRAKYDKHDDPTYIATPTGIHKKKTNPP